MTAINPQITKSYAAGNHSYMMTLIFQGARLSFYLLLLLSLPIIINANYVLNIWLKIVPEHSVSFVRLVLIFSMCESISNPLITAMLATGNIRNYQIIVGGLQMLNLPVSYIMLRMGCIPETVLIVAIVISQCCLAARLMMLRKMIGLSARNYLKKVYLNVIGVTLLSAVIPVIAVYSFEESFISFIVITVLSIISTALVLFYVGCTSNERVFVIENSKKMVKRFLGKKDDRN